MSVDSRRSVPSVSGIQRLEPADQATAQPELRICASVDHVGRRDVASLVLSGELCAASALALSQMLDALMEDGITHVVVDLSDLRSCTVTDVATLLEARRCLEARDGVLEITGSDGGGRTVADLLRIYTVESSFRRLARL